MSRARKDIWWFFGVVELLGFGDCKEGFGGLWRILESVREGRRWVVRELRVRVLGGRVSVMRGAKAAHVISIFEDTIGGG